MSTRIRPELATVPFGVTVRVIVTSASGVSTDAETGSRQAVATPTAPASCSSVGVFSWAAVSLSSKDSAVSRLTT